MGRFFFEEGESRSGKGEGAYFVMNLPPRSSQSFLAESAV